MELNNEVVLRCAKRIYSELNIESIKNVQYQEFNETGDYNSLNKLIFFDINGIIRTRTQQKFYFVEFKVYEKELRKEKLKTIINE